MTDESTSHEHELGGVAERSLSGTIIQGVAATGALAYGAGHLAEGVAKLKDAFGSGEPPAPQPPAEQPE